MEVVVLLRYFPPRLVHPLDVPLAVGAAHLRATAYQPSAARQISMSRDRKRTGARAVYRPLSVATMTSEEQVTPVQPAIENTEKHDFVSPTVSVDQQSRREKQEVGKAQTYILQQAVPTVQTLVPLSDAKGPSYTIRLDTIGSFLKPLPHMLIKEDAGGRLVAEVRFEVRGYDATIVYKDVDVRQRLTLRDVEGQVFECVIGGRVYRWRPLGPSKSVLELTGETSRRVALFAYAEGMAMRTGSTSGGGVGARDQRIGEVHVMEESLREPGKLQQTLFSAVVVVEQAKRRATGMASRG